MIVTNSIILRLRDKTPTIGSLLQQYAVTSRSKQAHNISMSKRLKRKDDFNVSKILRVSQPLDRPEASGFPTFAKTE